MREQLLETDAIEVPAGDEEEAGEELSARPLPVPVEGRAEVAVWSGDVKSAALAAAGGVIAGAATVAIARATRAATPRKRTRRALRGRDRPQNIVASRSFLVDVHLLGQK